jgi:hypothetical protein
VNQQKIAPYFCPAPAWLTAFVTGHICLLPELASLGEGGTREF